MPFQPSTLNKFLKLYSKYGFSGEDFLPPFNNTEKHYHNLRFEHKRNNTHYFLLTMTGSEGKNIVVGRIIYEPFLTKPYVAQSISKENENGLITHALKRSKLLSLIAKLKKVKKKKLEVKKIFF